MAHSMQAPDASMMSTYGQGHARYLASPSGNAGGDVLKSWALQEQAKRQQDQYLKALQAANQSAVQAQQIESVGKNRDSYLTNLAPMAERGIASALQFDPSTGMWVADQNHLQTADTGVLNDEAGTRFTKTRQKVQASV
jgi:hypothetical protein